MSATPTDGLNSVTFLLTPLMAFSETSGGQDYDVMNYTYTDERTGTTATTQINFRCDGNKIADDQGNTWLHVAAEAGCDRMVHGFVTKGKEGLDIDIRNREDMTPFMIAVLHGRQKVAEILLENGADINACIRVESPKSVSDKTPKYAIGGTALRIAAYKNDLHMVQFLLRNGASIAEDDKGVNPLVCVLGSANAGVVRALIEAGCNPHHLTRGGCNALHLAAAWENPDPNVIRMLIKEYHVNPNQKDNNGYTPLKYVRNADLTKFLLENGAIADGSEFPTNGERRAYDLWDTVIVLLEHGVVPTQPPLSRDHPFEAVAASTYSLENLGIHRALKITKLYLATGAKISQKMHTTFEAYFYQQGISLDRYPEFHELKRVVKANYSSCIIS
jgi:ankyrin repeat protein